jgi:hypothetical protein
MLPYRLKFFRLSRQKVSLLTLIGICALTFPMPLLEPSFKNSLDKEQATAYPCQHKACGCRTAEQCWTKCCCNSPEQRAAWAERNGVTPPSYAVLESGKGDLRVSKTKSCCLHRKSGSLLEAHSEAKSQTKEKRASRGFLIGPLVLKCHGQASDFSSMPWGVISDTQFESMSVPLVGDLVIPTSPLAVAVYLDPDKPPPRA